MSTHSADYKEAVDHLPEGATLSFEDVTWEEYERLLSDIGEQRPAIRVTYYQGKLEVMGPRPRHEEYKCFIEQIVHALAMELDLNVEPRGSATWKKKREASGTEADSCYYVANSERIIGKGDIDLNVDPPPDLAVEIDATSASLRKFPIYAALGVSEIWRYDVKHSRVHMYQLRGKIYVEIPASLSFPVLTPAALADAIDYSKDHGQKAALTRFRRLIREIRGIGG